MTSTKSQPAADPANLAIGKRIRVLAGKAGISQYRMAEAIGVAQPQVHQRLAGRIEWRINELTAIAELIGVPLSDLLGGSSKT